MSDGRLVLPVVLSATFVQLLNVTVAQVAAPAIQAGLGAGPGAVQTGPRRIHPDVVDVHVIPHVHDHVIPQGVIV
ncbi:hypothetical protein [Streptomyces sp. NPDC047841]|uniref:hypothetical protein n=1 Tax=Streptomyces sp. NPDC047841 TaxID=3154708 RepID=UPI0034559A72